MAGSKANKVAYFEKLKDLLDKYRESVVTGEPVCSRVMQS
jgi:hypothetical protein